MTAEKAPANKVEAYFIQYGKPALSQLNLFVKNTLGDASKLQITFSHVISAAILIAILALARSVYTSERACDSVALQIRGALAAVIVIAAVAPA